MNRANKETAFQILMCIRDYKAEFNGLSPSYRDIAENVGSVSTSTVQRYIAYLMDLGIVDQGPRRGLMLLHSQWRETDDVDWGNVLTDRAYRASHDE